MHDAHLQDVLIDPQIRIGGQGHCPLRFHIHGARNYVLGYCIGNARVISPVGPNAMVQEAFPMNDMPRYHSLGESHGLV